MPYLSRKRSAGRNKPVYTATAPKTLPSCLGDRQGSGPDLIVLTISVRVLVKQTAQATFPIKLLPCAIRLGEPIGNRIDDGRVSAAPDVACVHLDVLGLRCLAFQTALPCNNTVRPTEDRGGRNPRRRGKP